MEPSQYNYFIFASKTQKRKKKKRRKVAPFTFPGFSVDPIVGIKNQKLNSHNCPIQTTAQTQIKNGTTIPENQQNPDRGDPCISKDPQNPVP